jgi:excisionase family DNA binding protein
LAEVRGAVVAEIAVTCWLTVLQAAAEAQVAAKTIYKEVKAGRLRAARIGGRRDLRIHRDWVTQWLEQSAAPVEVRR